MVKVRVKVRFRVERRPYLVNKLTREIHRMSRFRV